MIEWITELRGEESVVLPPESAISLPSFRSSSSPSSSKPPAAVVASSHLLDRYPPRLAGINRIREGVEVTERSSGFAYRILCIFRKQWCAFKI
ncbi:unnamed protein product [Heligmosomoides polygyrus]|uniref:Uncharacterized protein n=1 Tax=Heligmosomoides polygyrus TaxID=6339 RepID=A0A183GG09_HELPZ|nr:unnamed protein product [Heligmosomoides polygyrus]